MILSFNEVSELFNSYGLGLTEKQYADLDKYAELLVDWNEKINLTAITDPEGITVKHFLDSLLIFKYVDIKDNSSYVDVGTGAGFPGIPIKIYRNDLDCTLIDSLNKRIIFLNDVSEKLYLPMKCIHSRAEDGGKNPDYREKYDISVARAVAALPVLCEYCVPYVKIGGKFIAMKGPNENYKDAYTAYKTLGCEVSDVFEYSLPNDEKRQIIVFNKIKETPKKYPRNSAQISKNTL